MRSASSLVGAVMWMRSKKSQSAGNAWIRLCALTAGERQGGLHVGPVLEADDGRDLLEAGEVRRVEVEH